MYAMLMTAAMLAQAPQAGTQPPTRDSQPTHSLDGTWTVLCFEKGGQPVSEAKDMTITIRNNVATCSGEEKSRPKSMRLEFASNGRIRVTELDTTVGTTGTQATQAPDAKNTRTGHYLLTKDYFCLCLKDSDASGLRTVGGEQPTSRTGDQPVRPAGGADSQPGSFTTSLPREKADACVVILKRASSNGSAPPVERRP